MPRGRTQGRSSPIAKGFSRIRVGSGPKPGQDPSRAPPTPGRWQESDQVRRKEENREEDRGPQGWRTGVHFSLSLRLEERL